MTKRDTPPADLDAIAAHLDRGWDLLRNNDPQGAEISARKALREDPGLPEALTLLGCVAHAQGEEEAALEHHRKALESDPEFVPALLYAAEILVDGEGPDERAEALKLTEDALDVAEAEDEVLDAMLLRAEILVMLGRAHEAEEALSELPPVRFPEGGFHLRAARIFLDVGRLDEAEHHFRSCLELEPSAADAWHGLGCVFEERADAGEMVKAWLRVRELDLGDDPAPWALSQEEFEGLGEEAIAELPERIRRLLENVPIIAADYPAVEIVAEGNDPRMMGFFSGVPYPEKTNVTGTAPHLDCVFLYKRNIERLSRNKEEVAREIRTTVLHETGHFFGLDEDELDEMGLG
jgi:predicted Zn-dependent protease with MMP-like domain/Flp pilus assembly protein TadD